MELLVSSDLVVGSLCKGTPDTRLESLLIASGAELFIELDKAGLWMP